MRNKLISLNLALILATSLFLPCCTLTAKAADDYGYATFYLNDGTDESKSIQIGTFLSSNCNLTLYEALEKAMPQYEGHVLVGFSSTAEGTATYRTSDIIKNVFSTDASNPGAVYAQWEEVQGNYVVYRCSDRNAEQEMDYLIVPITTGEITLAADSTFTTSNGQKVVAWTAGFGLNEQEYAPGSSVTVISGTEFTAVMGINYITFHDGETERFRRYPAPDLPVGEVGRQGTGIFSGWNTSSDGIGNWYYPLSKVDDISHELYAQYINSPTENQIVLSSQNGLAGGPMSGLFDLTGGKITLPTEVNGQQKVAYWYSESFQGRKYYPAGVSATVAPCERLEAQVINDGSYYGIVDGDGGLTADGSPYYATACFVTSAGNLNLYHFNDLVTFTKEGAAVSGYKGGKTGNVYSFNDDIWAAMGKEANESSIANFTAQYEQLSGSYIQYLGNGASTADGKSYIVQSDLDFANLGGKTYALNPFEAPEGKSFLGWNTQSNGRGDWYDPGKPITLSANTVLYAQWGRNRVSYYFEDSIGNQQTITYVDADKVLGAFSSPEDTSVSMIYSLTSLYGLRKYLSASPFGGYVTRLDAAKLMAALGELEINLQNTDLPFTDCNELNVQEKAIVKASVEEGLLIGTSSDTFGPENILTRAEMVALIWRLQGQPEPEETASSFQDVPPSAWYYPPVMSMREKGIIITDRDAFKPSDWITFLDVFRWAVAAYEVRTSGTVLHSDALSDSRPQTFFEGWNTKRSGSGAWYAQGDAISDGTIIDLYENWISTPTDGYYYVLTGRRMVDERTTNIVELDNSTASISLPSSQSFYGWVGGDLSSSDIAGKRGFIDETDNFYACGETVTVTTGDVFRPLTDSSGIFAVYHKNDGSSSEPRVYFYIASPASLELYGIGQVFDNLPAGKSFVAWNANSGGNGQSYTAGSSVRNSVQLFAQWKNSGGSFGNPGGGGGYISSAPSTTTPSVNTTGQNSSTETTTTTAVPTASTQGGTASTTVSTTMGNEIVKQAVANKSEDVVIAPKVTGNVTKTEVSIPASTVAQIGSQTNASLTIATPVANVTIPNGGLSGLSSTGGTVTVTAEKTGNTVELSVTMGGRTVDYVPGGVTLTVPVSYTTPGTVAVLVNADGTWEVVRKSVADNGSVSIPLDGSAKLEIVENSKYFADVPSTSWAADAVAFASSHELFNGTGANQFSPNLPMSRGMLAVVLHNLENNPAQAITGGFADVTNGAWYAEGVAWAAANGIVGSYGNGQFGPNDNITREQLAVMLWRYAGSPSTTGQELLFADAYRASSWALSALQWATENGIIRGKGNGVLDPTGQATRAETAQMLKNFLENA